VPVTPMISIVACLYLMFQLPRVTWIRFGIWLVLGLVVYFFYGVRHSRLRAAAAAAERSEEAA
jgi:APA family basic amino acid/polyamine antiporter